MIKIMLLSLMFSQAPQDTFKSNILKICELDTVSSNSNNRKPDDKLRSCVFYDLTAQFIFSDSTITVIYYDSTQTESTLIIDEKHDGFGLYTYNCHSSGVNSLLFYYKNINLLKLYFYNPEDKKTYVQFYLNTKTD